MKSFICLVTILASLSVFAKDVDPAKPCSSCVETEVRGKQTSGLEDIAKIAEIIPSENIKGLAAMICSHYAGDATEVAENVKKSVISHMKEYEKISSPTPTQIVKFLNKNKNFMLCGKTHYMAKSFMHGAYDELFNVFLFDYLLLDDPDLYVDINAISYTGPLAGTPPEPTPETTLDFMYRKWNSTTISKETKKEIKDLIDMFEDYLGGKRYANLPKEEKVILLVKN